MDVPFSAVDPEPVGLGPAAVPAEAPEQFPTTRSLTFLDDALNSSNDVDTCILFSASRLGKWSRIGVASGKAAEASNDKGVCLKLVSPFSFSLGQYSLLKMFRFFWVCICSVSSHHDYQSFFLNSQRSSV